MSFESSILSPAELAARRVGEVVAEKWRLERVLGAGGMATVFAASHTNNLRPAALKLLHPELAANADIKKRFLREGYIANRVGHPNSVAVLDDGVASDGTVFLVMELLVGESLADRRDKGRLSERETMRVADGVLDVLASAHEQGIVHRDLKPDNVFLTKDGAVKVLDFGIARLLEPPAGEMSTQTGVMMGTPAYMPPEQARGRSSQVDGRSDIWSLGAILFACLTGKHVHEAETSNEALLRAMTTPAPALRAVLPDADPKVAAIVDRALAFEPDDRWPNAQAMQAAVRDALASMDPTRSSPGALLPPSSGPRMVTAVTKAPIVQDVAAPRSSGGRVFFLLAAIGGLTLGVSWALRARPLGTGAAAGTGFDPPVVTAPPPASPDAAVAAAVAPVEDAGIDASLDGALDAGEDADVSDADVDADDDEYEDDDGGEDEDEVVDAAPARAAAFHSTKPSKAPPKHAPPKKKKRHKKKHR